MAKSAYATLVFITLLAALSSCSIYKQDVMFRTDKDFEPARLGGEVALAEANYQIKPNDHLRLEVYTNRGERIVDPNFELRIGNGNFQQQQLNNATRIIYIVDSEGSVNLPVVGKVELMGKTIFEAQTILESLYSQAYVDPYVVLRYDNKRVVVLGAAGGKIIPMMNESMGLPEVLALAGGLTPESKAQNIRVIRGNLANPEVYLVDLSTIYRMQETVVKIKPGDIIYIEPRRRVVNEAIRDISPILSLVTSTIALIAVLLR